MASGSATKSPKWSLLAVSVLVYKLKGGEILYKLLNFLRNIEAFVLTSYRKFGLLC